MPRKNKHASVTTVTTRKERRMNAFARRTSELRADTPSGSARRGTCLKAKEVST